MDFLLKLAALILSLLGIALGFLFNLVIWITIGFVIWIGWSLIMTGAPPF